MAASRRLLQMKHALFAIAPTTKPTSSLLDKELFLAEPARQFCLSSSIFTRNDFCRRAFQTQQDIKNEVQKDVEAHKSGSLEAYQDLASASSLGNSNNDLYPECSVASNLKISSRHDLAMIFTCKVCETRSIKTACRESYEKGVVVARCGGCNNLHLIADHLGWFGAPGSIEDFLAARGEEVKKGSTNTLNLTLEDLAGKQVLKE